MPVRMFMLKRIGRAKIRMNSRIFVDEMTRAVKDFGEQYIIPAFRETTRTWKEHHPAFHWKISRSDNFFRMEVVVTDRIYRFLNDGTSIRWAIMSKDWESKTAPGWIGSGPGRGRVTWRGRNRYLEEQGLLPKQGIDARNWTGLIEEEYRDRFRLDMRYAVTRAGKMMMNG